MSIKKIKILILVDHIKGIDGPHRNVIGTIEALNLSSKLDVTVLTGDLYEEDFKRYQNINIIQKFYPKNLRKVFSNYFQVLKYIRKVDIVYVPTNLTSWLYAFFTGASLKKFIAGPNVAGIPFLMNIHNPNKIMTTWFVDKWIENSEVRKRQCIEAGTNKKQIKVLPHCINTSEFTPLKRDKSVWNKYGLNPNKIKILHVGRATTRTKATKELMHIFKKLNKNNNYDLVFVGHKGKFWEKEFDNIPGIHYLGKVYDENLRVLYASSDIFFALSYWESFWFTPLEAMSSGLPIVVSDVGAVNTFIPENGIQGFRLDILNDKSKKFRKDYDKVCINILRNLCEDEVLRKKISYEGRRYIEKNFSLDIMKNNLEQLFENV